MLAGVSGACARSGEAEPARRLRASRSCCSSSAPAPTGPRRRGGALGDRRGRGLGVAARGTDPHDALGRGRRLSPAGRRGDRELGHRGDVHAPRRRCCSPWSRPQRRSWSSCSPDGCRPGPTRHEAAEPGPALARALGARVGAARGAARRQLLAALPDGTGPGAGAPHGRRLPAAGCRGRRGCATSYAIDDGLDDVGPGLVDACHPIQRPETPAIDWLDDARQPGDTGVVAFGAPNILQATGLRSPYPDLWSLPVRVHDPELHDLTALLGRAPTGRPGSSSPARSLGTWGIDATAANRVLADHYDAGATTGDWTIYREDARVSRRTAMTAYAVLLLAWCWFVGIPNDPAGVIVWIWLGTIAWQVEDEPRDLLAFWRDWWKPLLLMVVYWLGRGLADEIGIAPHYTMPIRVDEWLSSVVGVAAPHRRSSLQHAWCGDPCLTTLPPHWYDVLLTTVYASHFLVALTLAGVLWVRNRGRVGALAAALHHAALRRARDLRRLPDGAAVDGLPRRLPARGAPHHQPRVVSRSTCTGRR